MGGDPHDPVEMVLADPDRLAERIPEGEEFLRRLKRLAEAHAIPWRYVPLHTFLNEAEAQPFGIVRPASDQRLALPVVPH